MKIKDVKHYLLNPGWGKNLLFVKVITDNGLEGWGECYTQSDRDKTIIVHLEHMSDYLIGRDPFEIKYFNQIVFDDYASRRGSMEIFSALSGLEQHYGIYVENIQGSLYIICWGVQLEENFVYMQMDGTQGLWFLKIMPKWQRKQ